MVLKKEVVPEHASDCSHALPRQSDGHATTQGSYSRSDPPEAQPVHRLWAQLELRGQIFELLRVYLRRHGAKCSHQFLDRRRHNDTPSEEFTFEVLMLAASSSDILFRNGGYQLTKLTTSSRRRWIEGKSANIIVVWVLKHFTTKNDSLKRPLFVIDGKPTASVATQIIHRLEYNVWSWSLTKDNEFTFIKSQSIQRKHSKRNVEVLIHEAAAEFHPSAIALQGMARTLEFESHSEAADQREGVEQTQSNLQRSQNASNEGCRKYFHLYEEFPKWESYCGTPCSSLARSRETVDLRDLGSSVPKSKSQTNLRRRNCETEVGSPEL